MQPKTMEQANNRLSRELAEEGLGMADFVPAIAKAGGEWRVGSVLPGAKHAWLNGLGLSNESFRKQVNERLRGVIGRLSLWSLSPDRDLFADTTIDALWGRDGPSFLINGGASGMLVPNPSTGAYTSMNVKNADAAVILAAALTIYLGELLKAGDVMHGKPHAPLPDGNILVRIKPYTGLAAYEKPDTMAAAGAQAALLRAPADPRVRPNAATKAVLGFDGSMGDVIPVVGRSDRYAYTYLRFFMAGTLTNGIKVLNQSREFTDRLLGEMKLLSEESLLVGQMGVYISSWREFGPTIDCEVGNATMIYPSSISGMYPDRLSLLSEYVYSEHNIDTATQAVALLMPLLIYLKGLYAGLDDLASKSPGMLRTE